MKSWLWPDRTIGKRESRLLREEHNKLVNTCDNLAYHLTTTAVYKHEGEKHAGSYSDCSNEVCTYLKGVVAQAEAQS